MTFSLSRDTWSFDSREPISRSIARSEMYSETSTRNPASASAERCSALPCPNWWAMSAGRDATRIAKYVSSAATRSVPECAASETRPRLCVARPTDSFSTTSAAAAATETSAERRCGLTAKSLDLLEAPHHDVLPRREEHMRLLVRQGQRRHRVPIDHRLAVLQVPRRVVDVGAVEPAAVLGVEAVTLGEEVLERPGLRLEQRALAAIVAAKRRASTHRLVVHVVADTAVAHL